MHTTTKMILAVLLPLTVISCVKDENTETQITTANKEVRIENTLAAQDEQMEVAKLDTLTDENLDAQIEMKSGKKVLKDRRLFVNYLQTQKVNTSKKLLTSLQEIDDFVKGNGVTLSESDILVMIAGSQIENPSFSVCGDFHLNKKTLDKKHTFYPYLDRFCSSWVSGQNQ